MVKALCEDEENLSERKEATASRAAAAEGRLEKFASKHPKEPMESYGSPSGSLELAPE